MSINAFLKKRSALSLYVISLALLCLLYTLNLLVHRDLSFSIFYLGPIAMTAWYLGFWRALPIAVLSTIAWYHTEAQMGALYSHPSFAYWNAAVRFLFFLLIAYLLAALHRKLREQERLADTDALTGALNSRGFIQRAEAELERARRYEFPCSLAYVDLDDFKAMNDTHGHAKGDELLREIVAILHQHTRRSDIVGRLGGDEFAIFYTEADEDAALKAVRKLHAHIRDEMDKERWPVTVSIGVATVHDGNCSLMELVKAADNRMYAAKKEGKNRINQIDPAAGAQPAAGAPGR